MMAGFLLVGRVLFLLLCCMDTEVTALHNSSVLSPWLQSSQPVVTKDSSEVGQPLFTVPPFFSSFPFEFVLYLSLICQLASSLAVLGRAFLSLVFSCVFSRGAVDSR